jgi:hypothetical protein
MPSFHGKQGSMRSMETRNLEDGVRDVTCRIGTMNPRPTRYQFRPGPKMVDEAWLPCLSDDIADELAMAPSLLTSLGGIGNLAPLERRYPFSLVAGVTIELEDQDSRRMVTNEH